MNFSEPDLNYRSLCWLELENLPWFDSNIEGGGSGAGGLLNKRREGAGNEFLRRGFRLHFISKQSPRIKPLNQNDNNNDNNRNLRKWRF